MIVTIAVSTFLNHIAIVFLIRAFPALFLFLAGGTGVLLAIGFVLLGAKKNSRGGYLNPKIFLTCVSLLSFALGFLFMPSGRPVLKEEVPPRIGEQIRVLSWNTDNRVSDSYLLELAESLDPDIIAYPEEWQISSSDADCTEGAPEEEGGRTPHLCEIAQKLNMRIYFIPDASQSTLLIKKSFGEYEVSFNQLSDMAFSGFVAKPLDKHKHSPQIFLAHIQRPDFTIGTTWWYKHIAWARENCNNPNTIMLGDFNATLANLASNKLGQCQDVAASLGQKSTATWPTFLPSSLGVAIDHIFVGSSYSPIYYGVLVGSDASDHRPIFSILKPHETSSIDRLKQYIFALSLELRFR